MNDENSVVVGQSPNGYPIYEEPRGYACEHSFVKSNPLNNEAYLDIVADSWEPVRDILFENHEKIKEIFPGYNISQVKEKFYECRFYYDAPLFDDWAETQDENLSEEDLKKIYSDKCKEISKIARDIEIQVTKKMNWGQ